MDRIEIFRVLLILSCGYGLIKGGKPERAAVVVILAGFTLTFAVLPPMAVRYLHLEVGTMMVDTAMLGCFIFLALNAERFWTLWICAMQTIQVLAHLPIMFIPELLPQAYGVVAAVWSYPMIAVLVAGTYRHQQRLKRYGTDKSWSSYLPE